MPFESICKSFMIGGYYLSFSYASYLRFSHDALGPYL